jgi:outer membrane receptor protein involved in Fe transport
MARFDVARLLNKLAIGVSLPALWSGIAIAQTAPPAQKGADTAMEEIVVTATKHAEEISKVPISIAAYTQDQMDIAGVRTVQDIAALTPGFDFTTTTNPTGGGPSSGGSAVISIRGISSVNGDATTGIYIDDMAVQVRNTLNGTSGSTFPRIFDLSTVEIDRGPQGTLFGAGAEGGSVRFITPQPSLTDYTGYARTEIAGTEGGGPSYEGGVAVGGPIIPDKLGFRVSAWYREDGGYVDHTDYQTGVTQTNDNWQDTKAIKGALLFAPTDWLKFTPSVYYQYQHSNDTSVYWPTLSNANNGSFVNGNANQLPYTDQFTLPSLKIDADLGPVTLTSISSYLYRSNHANADETNFEFASAGFGIFFPTIPGGADVSAKLINKTTQHVGTEEVRLSNTDQSGNLNWLVGMFYSDSQQHDEERDLDPRFGNVLAELGLTPLDYFGENLLSGKYSYYGNEISTEYQLAGFGNLSYKITDELTASAGVRVSESRFSYFLYADGPLDGGPSLVTGQQKDTPVTPRFNVSWQPDGDNLIYATAAKGYRIGGVNPPLPQTLCATDLANIGLKAGPETYNSDSLWSYELGSKNRLFNGSMEIEASVFHIDWNQIQQKVVLPTCAFAFTENTGSVASNGFDLKVTERLTPHFLVGVALGYTDTSYQTTVAAGKSVIVESGDALGQTPIDLTVTAQYDFTLPGDRAGYIRAEDIFHSENSGPYTYQHPDAYNYDTTLVPNPATNQVNLRLGVDEGGFDVSVFVDNLFNTHPQLGLSHTTTSSPVYNAITFQPLTAGVTTIYKF